MKKLIKAFLITICLFAVFISACSKTVSTDEVKKPSDTDSITENTETTKNTENTESTESTDNTEDTQNTENTESNNKPTGDNIGDVGGSGWCPVHYYEYHSFYGELIAPLGDEFYEWVDSEKATTEKDSGCKYPGGNIKAFIDYFDYPRETFERVCATEYTCAYDIDLLYSDDIDAIEAYFRDVKSRENTVTKQSALNALKDHLLSAHFDVSDILSNGTQEEREKVLANHVSMFEVAEMCNCSRSEIENAIQMLNKERSYNLMYNYNLDVLFDADGDLKPYDKSLGRVKLDEMFCGIDNWYTD